MNGSGVSEVEDMSRRPAAAAGGWGPRPPRPPAHPPSPPPTRWAASFIFLRTWLKFSPDSSGPLCSLLARADHLLSTASLGAAGSSLPSGADEGELSLEERLLKLHAQEAVRDTRATHLNLASNLLDR